MPPVSNKQLIASVENADVVRYREVTSPIWTMTSPQSNSPHDRRAHKWAENDLYTSNFKLHGNRISLGVEKTTRLYVGRYILSLCRDVMEQSRKIAKVTGNTHNIIQLSVTIRFNPRLPRASRAYHSTAEYQTHQHRSHRPRSLRSPSQPAYHPSQTHRHHLHYPHRQRPSSRRSRT